MIRQAKIIHYQNEFKKYKGNIKKTWGTINSILNRNRKVNNFPSHIISQKGKLDNIQDIVNEFNDYFCNIGQALAQKIPDSRKSFSHFLKKQIHFTFSFSLIDKETILKVLNDFKPKSSKDSDGLSMKLLKLIKTKWLNPSKYLSINQ